MSEYEGTGIRRMRSCRYVAWVDAGQRDIKKLIDYTPMEEELRKKRVEGEAWKKEWRPGSMNEQDNWLIQQPLDAVSFEYC